MIDASCRSAAHAGCYKAHCSCRDRGRSDERDAIADYIERHAADEYGDIRLALQSYARDIRHGDHRNQ